MKTPTKKDQKQVRDAESGRVGVMNTESLSTIVGIGVYVQSILPAYMKATPKRRQAILKQLERKVSVDYKTLLELFSENILDALNKSSDEQRFLVVNTLGREPKAKPFPIYTRFPRTDEFAITRRILSEKSILNRSRGMAKQVSDVVRESQKAGLSIRNTTKRVEIQLGLRSRDGKRLTTNAKRLLRTGKFSHTNGHFYDFYRIARTETMRMASIQSNNQFKDLIESGEDTRLQMVAVLDGRTREQSIEINGKLSRKDGKFKYPNGFYYEHGKAPARWTINDRETTITVFLDDEPKGDLKYKSVSGYRRAKN